MNLSNITIAGMTLYQICWYFLFYSFCGWVVEVIFHAMDMGKILNRGFLNGPLCPVYGFGVLAVLAAANLASSGGILNLSAATPTPRTLLILFLGSLIFATLVELIAGWLLDTLFHMRWWDYSNRHFNFHGYICLGFSLIWGLAITAVILLVHPIMARSPSFGIPERIGWPLLGVLYVLTFADLAVTVAAINGLNKRLKELDTVQKNMRVLSDRLSQAIGERSIQTSQLIGEGQVQAALAGAELRDALDEQAAKLAKKRSELVKKPGEWKDARLEELSARREQLEERREQLEARREQLLAELKQSHLFSPGHILRNVPELTHRDYREALESLKERLHHTEKPESFFKLRSFFFAGILGTLLFFSSATQAAGTIHDLENGDTSEDLKLVQQSLIDAGYLEDKADGVFGPKTEAALLSWCKENSLDTESGTLLDVLIRVNSSRYKKNISKDPLSVYIIQRRLTIWGLLEGKIDSLYGSKTEAALETCSELAGDALSSYLKEKAAADKQRRDASPLFRIYDARKELVETLTGEALPSGAPGSNVLLTRNLYDFLTGDFVPAGEAVASGSKGADALRVQKRLKKLKYLAAGIDGSFGKNSVLALKYFQRLNGLAEDGICAEETWKALLSETATPSDQYVSPYKARVDTSKNRVKFYAWDGSGYNRVAKEFVCSTGAKSTPTIKGTFQASGQIGDWYYMKKSNVWVRYAFQISGNYLFHSVLFNEKGDKKPTSSSVNNLGSSVSHGCVRLSVEDAKWVYDNCSKGMTVVIE